jgi:LacI family transcriptional regulator
MGEKVTMQDVAKKAGVDKATVSRVLKGDPRISEKTRENVINAVRVLEYRLDRNASNLSTNKSGIIGVVLRDMSVAWLPSFLTGLDRTLSNSDYDIIIKCTESNPLRAERELRRLTDRNAEGIIWCDGSNIPSNVSVPVISLGFKMDVSLAILFDSAALNPTFDTGVLAGRLLLNVISGKFIPSREIIVRGESGEN